MASTVHGQRERAAATQTAAKAGVIGIAGKQARSGKGGVMRYEGLTNIVHLAIRMQGRRGGVTLDDIRAEFGVSRRTAERMRDAVEWAFGPLDIAESDDNRRHWRLRSDALRRLMRVPAAELADLSVAVDILDSRGFGEQAAVAAREHERTAHDGRELRAEPGLRSGGLGATRLRRLSGGAGGGDVALRGGGEASGWESLSDEEKKCYHGFLLELREGDYVVYVNVPEWGKCTLARVAGPYEWRWEDKDFNHRFPVDRDSVHSFDRNSTIVPAALSARLKLRGRWWRVYAETEFEQLLNRLQEDQPSAQRTLRDNLRELSDLVRPSLAQVAEHIHRTHPNKDLESLMEQLFRRVPGVRHVERLQGKADKGADLLVDFEFVPIPGLVQTRTLAVQVKSFGGSINDTDAVEDLRRAFEHYETSVDMGLVVTTASEVGKNLLQEMEKLSEESEKPVSIMAGTDLVVFFLQHASDLVISDDQEPPLLDVAGN